ncbi:hypothetical protein [Myxococcus hansupus]|nr:hypothetical protein [Myxococcus hansupus]
MNAMVVAVAMAMTACGGVEEDVAPDQVPAVDLQAAESEDTYQQAISCDPQGRCPPGFVCGLRWTCRYVGGRDLIPSHGAQD